jgi:hypothetical protein
MNRRRVIVGLGGGALSLLAAAKAEATTIWNPATGDYQAVPSLRPRADCSPAHADGIITREVLCLPEGPLDLETPDGDVVTVTIPASGTIVLKFSENKLLRGLWELYKPGTGISGNKLDGTRPFFDPISARVFDLLDSTVVPDVPGFPSRKIWVYRHPIDYPGTTLRGRQGEPMAIFLDSGLQPIGPVSVDLVDLDLAPQTYQDLQALPYPPLPPVRAVLASWHFPAGVGGRQINLEPIEIGQFTRGLAITARVTDAPVGTPIRQTCYVRLRSLSGPLEIIP